MRLPTESIGGEIGIAAGVFDVRVRDAPGESGDRVEPVDDRPRLRHPFG
jgi:hypothetical protein